MKKSGAGLIATGVVGDLFVERNPAKLKVKAQGRAELKVFSSDGKTVAVKTLERGVHEVDLGRLPVDHYTAAIERGREETRFTFGVVPRRKFKGAGGGGGSVYAKCGMRFSTVGLCFDGVLKGKPGEMDWKDNRRMADGWQNWFPSTGPRNVPELARAVAKTGQVLVGSVDLKSGNWEIGDHGTMRLVPIYEHLDEVGPCVYEYVKRCKLKYLIVWNEPDFYWNLGEEAKPEKGGWQHGRFIKAMPMQEYVNLLKTCYEAAKKADPKCQVILGASLGQGQFTENVYRFGGKPYFDIVGIHYLSGNSLYDFGHQVRYLRQIMARYGDDKPIFDTEFGCGGAQSWDAISGGTLFTAAFETKYVALSVMHNTIPCTHFMPLTGRDGAPAHAVALSVITWLLDGATFVRDLKLGRNDAGLLFRRKNGAMCGVFWAEKRMRVVVKTDAASVVSRSILGPTRRVKTENGLLKLDLNDVPVILEGFHKLDVSGKPYDCHDYRQITDSNPITMSRATTDLPRPFPRVKRGTIKVDGDLRDWAAIPAICTPNEAQKVKALKKEDFYKFDRYQCLMGEARVAYDQDNFYVAAVVKKDRKSQVNTDVANVMLGMRGFDWGVQWSSFSKGHSMVALMSRPGGPNVIQTDPCDSSIPEREITEARIVVRSLPKDLVFEAAIPWSVFRPIRPKPGKTIEFSILFGGDDGTDYYWWYRIIGTHWFVRPPARIIELRFPLENT